MADEKLDDSTDLLQNRSKHVVIKLLHIVPVNPQEAKFERWLLRYLKEADSVT